MCTPPAMHTPAMSRQPAARVRRALGAVCIALVLLSSAAWAQPEPPSGADMVVDLVVMRPLGLLGVVLGSAAFVIALPFTVPSGSVDRAAEELVKKPVRYTFRRPLGEIYEEQK